MPVLVIRPDSSALSPPDAISCVAQAVSPRVLGAGVDVVDEVDYQRE